MRKSDRAHRLHPLASVQAVGWEVLLVGVVGGVLALMANQLSPRGLSLTRDYFPAVPMPVAAPSVTGAEESGSQLSAHGLQGVDRAAVEAFTRDPRYAQGGVLLLDARNDAQYRAGHIPGALQFDHYRAEQHLATVIPACLTAELIVVYCGGGTCEDSIFAALLLRDAGIPGERLRVYEGGIADWEAAGLPVETGIRFSGEGKPATP